MHHVLNQGSVFVIATPPDRAFRIISSAVDLSLYIESVVSRTKVSENFEEAFPDARSSHPPAHPFAYPLENVDKVVLSVGLRDPSLVDAFGMRSFHAVVASLSPSPAPSVTFMVFRNGIEDIRLNDERDMESVRVWYVPIPVDSISSFSFTAIFLRILPPSRFMFVTHDNPDLSSYRLV